MNILPLDITTLTTWLIVAAITFFANYLKGVIGTGTGTVMMALSTFVIDPKLAVVVIAYISVFSSLMMIRLPSVALKQAFWVPIMLVIGLGAGAGAMALKYVPADIFKTILGIAFLLGAFWFGFKRRAVRDFAPAPDRARPADLAVAAGSGFMGGFVGVNAAPLVIYFGSFLDKQQMRRLFVLIFTGSTITQTATFLGNGMLTREAVALSWFILPVVALGVWLGNRSHVKISETLFGRILSVFLVVAALRMIWQGVMGI